MIAKVAVRLLWALFLAWVVYALSVWAPAVADGAAGWQTSSATAYSRHSSGATNGCDGSVLHDGDLSVATFLVPCGARVELCYGRRCVHVVRRDSGPYPVGAHGFDLNIGVVRALGISSERSWGIRTIRWRRLA